MGNTVVRYKIIHSRPNDIKLKVQDEKHNIEDDMSWIEFKEYSDARKKVLNSG